MVMGSNMFKRLSNPIPRVWIQSQATNHCKNRYLGQLLLVYFPFRNDTLAVMDHCQSFLRCEILLFSSRLSEDGVGADHQS